MGWPVPSEKQLAATFQAAMQIWDAQKREGISQADRLTALEQSLRAAWPEGRSEPWHYYCDRCSDTGWECRTCRPGARCGMPFKLPKQHADDFTGQGRCADGHGYAVPCTCGKGREYRRQLLKESRPDEDFTTAGAVRRKPTRLGR